MNHFSNIFQVYGRYIQKQCIMKSISIPASSIVIVVLLSCHGLTLAGHHSNEPKDEPVPIKPDHKDQPRTSRDNGYGFFDALQEARSAGAGLNGTGFFSNGLIGISEFVMSKVENSLDDLPSLPRLEPQECMKRSICEANHQPKKYGILGLAIQLLFPPYTESNNPTRVVSKYQLAARYGRQETANCAGQYDGCMFNFLEVVQTVVGTVFKFS